MLTPDSITQADAARFWSKVDRSGGLDACHPWMGWRSSRGYGRISVGGRMWLAHRLAYILAAGPIPRGKPHVCHSCDNPSCCNPAHLWPGTDADNVADRDRKGRGCRGDLHPTRTKPESYADRDQRGEKNGNARLTEAQVRDVRARHDAGESARGLARVYGVSKTQIRRIVTGESWQLMTASPAPLDGALGIAWRGRP